MTSLYTFERIELDRLAAFERRQIAAAKTAALRKQMESDGFVQVRAWVTPDQRYDLLTLLAFLHSNPDFTVGPARHIMTGRLRKPR